MPSSTSNSRKVTLFVVSFLVTLALWGLAAELVWPERKLGNLQDQAKALAGPNIPIVVAGDSRVHNGVSPEAMTDELPGRAVQNFGWSGAGYGPAFLQAIAAVNAESSERIIVLGISPSSLTASAARQNGYTRWAELNLVDRWVERHLGRPLALFTPARPTQLLQSRRAGGYAGTIYSASGWIGVPTERADLERNLDYYRRLFARRKVSSEIQREILSSVRSWTDGGVRVYGFWPPVSAAMKAVEDECSGVQRADFVTAFEAAGGTWLHFDESQYECFDGGHLNAREAKKFSRDLARELRRSQP